MIYGIIITIIIAIIFATYCVNQMDKNITETEIEKLKENTITFTETDLNGDILTPEELDEKYKSELLKQIQNININLIDIQVQQSKLDKKLSQINKNVNIIKIIMVAPIIIGIIILLMSIIGGHNMLQRINAAYQTTPQATAYVTDQDGNIIPNEEYHGQNVAVPTN